MTNHRNRWAPQLLWRTLLLGVDRAVAAGWRGWLTLALGLALSWWIYVPVHELAHAFGCLAAGGDVSRLELAPEYGAVLLAVELASMIAVPLKRLVFGTGGAFVVQQDWGSLARDTVALAYQLGSLLLPMVTPLVVWLAGHGSYLAHLNPRLGTSNR